MAVGKPMRYKTFLQLRDEQEYRDHFKQHYVLSSPILTFDSIAVSFKLTHHIEILRKEPAPGQLRAFCPQRAERLDWIKAGLQDPNANLYFGYDRKRKTVDYNRRVAIVAANYAIIIRMTAQKTAEFVTAYIMDERSLKLATRHPDWNETDCVWS